MLSRTRVLFCGVPLVVAALLTSCSSPSAAPSASAPATSGAATSATSSDAGWAMADAILARIRPPQFQQKDFDVTQYGASPDGVTDSTSAIAKAIDACAAAGGGRVVIPSGTVLTGAVHLKSNVNLHVAKGATLKFSPDPAKYLPVVLTRYEGTELMNYSPLIYAYGQENIAVTGEGTLDGSADDKTWWAWTKKGPGSAVGTASRKKLVEMADKGVPVEQRVFGENGNLRPNFVQFYRCKNILIEGVHIVNSPMWELHPVLSSNITVRGVEIHSHGPNNDGCDPESCSDVLIENCIFDTGDDCIAIKSGRDNDGRRINVPSENFVIRNCVMQDGHGGVVIGSEISGGCRNVFAENCKMDSPNLDRALRLKSNARRGGVIENIRMRNVQVGQVSEAVLTIDFLYDTGAKGDYKPVVRDVYVENVTSEAAPRMMWIGGIPQGTIEGIHFKNCTFRGLTATEFVQHAGTIEFDHVTALPAKKVKGLNSIDPTAAP